MRAWRALRREGEGGEAEAMGNDGCEEVEVGRFLRDDWRATGGIQAEVEGNELENIVEFWEGGGRKEGRCGH